MILSANQRQILARRTKVGGQYCLRHIGPEVHLNTNYKQSASHCSGVTHQVQAPAPGVSAHQHRVTDPGGGVQPLARDQGGGGAQLSWSAN